MTKHKSWCVLNHYKHTQTPECDCDERFHYVIGFYWDEPFAKSGPVIDDRLAFYTYGSEIHRGNMESAEHLLSYVKRTNRDFHGHGPYKIFKIKFEELA